MARSQNLYAWIVGLKVVSLSASWGKKVTRETGAGVSGSLIGVESCSIESTSSIVVSMIMAC